jgi:hypothetical protein
MVHRVGLSKPRCVLHEIRPGYLGLAGKQPARLASMRRFVIRSIIPDRLSDSIKLWHGPQIMAAGGRSDCCLLHSHHEYKALM